MRFDQNDQDDFCGICLQPFEEGEQLKALLCHKDKHNSGKKAGEEKDIETNDLEK